MEGIASSFTMFAGITAACLGIGLTESTGSLFRSEQRLVVHPATGKLFGTYADGTLVLSTVAGALAFSYGCIMLTQWAKGHLVKSKALLGILLACVFSMICSILNIVLIETYGSLLRGPLLQTVPANPPLDSNFKLRGSYGIGVLTISSLTIVSSIVAMFLYSTDHPLENLSLLLRGLLGG
jgi:hypothetical protein